MLCLMFLLSSTILIHELGNRFLAQGTLLGFAVNARAISCLAHALGVVVGFGAIGALHAKTNSLDVAKRWVWVAMLMMQALLCMGFYITLHPFGDATATCIIQLLSGMLGSVFFISLMRIARRLQTGEFIFGAIAYTAGTALIIYGLFSILDSFALVAAVASVHLALVVAGGVLFLWLAFKNPVTSAIFVDCSAPSVQLSNDGGTTAGRTKRVPPFTYLWIALCSYGLVFGVLHVIPLGLPATQFSRVVANLLGMVMATALIKISLPQREITTTLIWNRMYRLVFPFVTLAALLISFTGGSGFIPSLACAESAQYFFDMLLAIACFAVCKTTGVQSSQIFAHAFLARYVGFFVGDFIAMLIHEFAPMTTEVFSAIGIAVFLLLVTVTFNVNGEKYAKTAWGILPKESPKALYQRNLNARCEQLANDNRLTAREREVLLMLAQGKRPKEISEELVVSVATVRTHVQGVYNKLDVHSYDDLLHLIRNKIMQ